MKGRNCLRSFLLAILLAGGAAGLLQTPVLAQAPAQQQASPWKDRAEYDAFNAIVKATDPKQKVDLADKYLAAYPQTKFAKEVYELKLQAYQSLNDTPNMEATANKLLEIDPKNLRALLLLSYLFPRTAAAQDPATMDQNLAKASEHVQTGLAQIDTLTPPQGTSPEDFQKQKDQTASVFHQTAGFIALQKKDYPTAVQELTKSTQTNPNDALGFYWLGLAYLSPKPPDYEHGVWAMAHALSITGTAALPDANKATVKDYVSKVYEARHGSDDGLDDLLAKAATSPTPPDGFHIVTADELAPPPPPQPPPEPPKRELSVKPEELTDFSVIRKYLEAGGDKEADTWTILKGQTVTLPGKLVSAKPESRPTKLLVAVAPDLQTPANAGKYDVEVTLAEPNRKPLEPGQSVTFAATFDSYTAKPFLLKMVAGKITGSSSGTAEK